MAEPGRQLRQPHSTGLREREHHKKSPESQPQGQMQTQQQRRYFSAQCPREQSSNHQSAQHQLQQRRQHGHNEQLRRPFSSIRPPQQAQNRQNQKQQEWDSSGHATATAAPDCNDQPPLVLFDISKKERGDPSTTYKCLARQLQEHGMRYAVNTEGSLTPENLRHASLVVLAHPSQPFSSSEIESLRNFLSGGKSILAMLGEGGEREAKTNINYFLEEYGLTICSDTVVRTVAAGPAHLHPKETLISDGFLCGEVARENDHQVVDSSPNTGCSRRSSGSCRRTDRNVVNDVSPSKSCTSSNSRISSAIGTRCTVIYAQPASIEATSGSCPSSGSVSRLAGGPAEECGANWVKSEDLLPGKNTTAFVFPYGATVSVQSPAFPFLSSGLVAFPSRRPLGAAFIDSSSDGRLVALGSYRIFDDTFLHKENNTRLQQLIFGWLLRQQPDHALKPRQLLDPVCCTKDNGAEPIAEADLAERSQAVPDTASMAERVMPCFQESEQRISADFRDLHEEKVYSVNLDMLPEVRKAYKQLNVKYEPLSIIKPEFEVPMPRLIPAVHPPVPMELSPPPLELFDLDAELASPRTRLAYLTNRCTDSSLTYYVQEAAHIVGYKAAGQDSEADEHRENEEVAKKILWGAFAEIVMYKNQHDPEEASTSTEKARDSMNIPKSSAAQL